MMIPDAEAIVTTYLQPHVAALGARVASEPPSKTAPPMVRLTQLDARNAPGSRAEHLISYMLQLDCYSSKDGSSVEASLLARIVRAALIAMPDVDHGDAVVTSARIVSMPRIPDTSFEPARQRFIITAIVHMHAAAGGS